MNRPLRALGVVGAIGAAVAVYATSIERNAFTVRHLKVPVLPVGSPSIRVLHLSDLHLAPWQHRKVQWLRGLAEWYPDFVVNTGDNFGYADALPALREALAPLLSVPGIYVDGNNDAVAPHPRNPFTYFWGPSKAQQSEHEIPLDIDGLHALFDNAGWRSLNNTATTLTVNGIPITWFGTGDAHRDRADVGATGVAVQSLEPAASESALRVGVTHAPYQSVLNALTSLGADLLLAGHTHGGQVCIPGYGAIVANCDLPTSQASGLSDWTYGERTIPLHVSNGIGTSVYAPIRFACRPSVTLLELQPRSV